VTGSSHCTLIPYWAERLGRTELRARQISPRGGDLTCIFAGERVTIGGRCVSYLEGMISL
jgi:predicted PhzF superfamily epimerase YddE/YHI9